MKVLFVCTGNTCRSPMAEVIFNEMYKNHHAESRGLHTRHGDRIEANALRVLKREYGFDENRIAEQVTYSDINEADIVIAMTEAHKRELSGLYGMDNVRTLKELAGSKGDIIDPYGMDEFVYRRVFSEIRELLERIRLFREE
ncbi:low molecular weight protein arginine phosphatase [Youngiibacter multivorans]|nr:low molecular weight protein arginine phosphatase [Youngiibacter multivorans]